MSSLKEIAQLTGVSISTVSNVLNGRKNVSQETRDRILRCCEEQGYVHDASPKKTKSDRDKRIVFIFSDFDREFYLKIIEGVSTCLNENGYDLIICTNKSSDNFLKSSFARGTISLDGSLSDEYFKTVAKPEFPVVLMDRVLENDNKNTKSVLVDNYPVMRQMVQSLVDRGFQRFGFLGGNSTSLDNKERFAGFADTLQENGIAFDQSYYYHGNYREKSGYQAAKLMILSNDYPEVLVCANDNMAIGAMKAFEEHQISVPQNISITGFDDSDAAALAGLTTIKIPRYESGFLAAKELLELIKGNVNRETVKIGASIIWRQSVRS
ncbi:LacI family DNA-binding transcriptional regulator [Paenibacillus sp. NPDC058174]|uniref:LacI family DNA-binding transcriptional regulator n=1 Tax=Paenibacillus sp. NPDC058174 TaxID=3346366 RepID=UPI0036DC0D7E